MRVFVGRGCLQVLLLLLVVVMPSNVGSAGELLCGIDRLDASGCRELLGRRVALVTNVAGVARSGEADYRVLLRHGVDLRCIMAPEHGFAARIEAGLAVGNSVVAGGVPVVSLYGASKKPSLELMSGLDLVVFDLQDVGSRCYTYISTMKMVMGACRDARVPFMVLDRPNPVAPLGQSGFMVTPGYESFVGAVNVPFVHGMTIGEIALLLQQELFPDLEVQVVTMDGYCRDLFGDELPGFVFRSPSPNIKSVSTAVVYPATVFFEAMVVSEGRGTDAPFEQFGAPFIDAGRLQEAVSGYGLPGVAFDAVSFVPRSGKFAGERCFGLRLRVGDRHRFDPFLTSVALLLELQRLYGGAVGLDVNGRFFDRLAGGPVLRQMVRELRSSDEIAAAAQSEIKGFRSRGGGPVLYR